MTEGRTLHHWLGAFARHGDRPAVIELGKEGAQRTTYEQVDRLIGRLAQGLTDREIGRGERVALLAPASLSWIAACLGVLRAGAVPVPLDVQLDDDALVHVLGDSRPRLVLTDSTRAARLEELKLDSPPDTVLLDDRESDRGWRRLLAEKPGESPRADPEDEAVLFYTSGTTGPPKGVPLTHRNIAAQLEVLSSADLLGDDRVLLPLPLHHVYPFVVGMLAPLVRGLPLALPYSLTGPQIVRALGEADITVVIGVPRLYRALYDGIRSRAESRGRMAAALFRLAMALGSGLRRRLGIRAGKWLFRPLHRQLGPGLRVLACGGSPLDQDLAWKLESFGWQVAIGYGLTETSPLLTLNPPGRARIGTVGRAVSGVEIRIDDLDESVVAADSGGREIGEILARGPGVFRGYLNLPEETDRAFTGDGWFRTGDLGYLDDDGFLHVTGRKGTMIVTEGGENVWPEDVERAYARHPVIREIGVLEDDGGIAALIVPEVSELSPDQRLGLEDEVRRAVETLAREVPSYQRPGDVRVTRESLPRTRLGKIQRHKLRERFERAAGEESSGAATGPMSIEDMSSADRVLLADPAARETWDLLAERFADRRVTPDANLQLDLGVDSLEWLSLSLDIRRRAGFEIDEETIGRIDTVRQLLEEAVEAPGESARADSGTPLDDPESTLDETQLRHLEPRGPLTSLLARGVFAANRLLLRAVFRLEVHGVDRLPDGPLVIAPNHTSYLDPLAIAAALPRERLRTVFWGGWTGALFTNPVTRWISRVGQVVPVDPRRGVMSSLAFGAAVIARGNDLVWFPEGERSADGRLRPFRGGIGLVLERHPAIVVPTAIQGAYEALPPGSWLPRPRRILVRFGEPLEVGDLREAEGKHEPHERIAAALRDAVASELGGE